jgi:membrane protein YdbS with pleckstrin-like domain
MIKKLKRSTKMKNNNNEVNVSIGGGFSGLLFIAFLILKLCNVITWSWWWVTAPLWIPVAFVVVVSIICVIVLAISEAIESRRWRK